MVFVGSCNGFFRALDKRTGTPVWTYDTRQDGGPSEFHGNPVVTNNLVVIASDHRTDSGKGFVYAFEPNTGKVVWKYAVGHGAMTDLLLQNSILYVVTLDDELLGLDVATGHLRWRFSSGASNEDLFTNSTPALFGGRVIFGALDGIVYALDAVSGVVAWKQPLSFRISTSIAVFGASGYVGTIAGRLYRLDLTTGAVSADVPLDGPAEGKLTVCGKSLLGYLGNQGLFGLEVQDKKIRWTQLAAKEWTSARPYCSGESVLVGDHDVPDRLSRFRWKAVGHATIPRDHPRHRNRQGNVVRWNVERHGVCVSQRLLRRHPRGKGEDRS